MRLRSRPVVFARLFADAATTRPFLRDLLEQRRASEPRASGDAAQTEGDGVPTVLPRAA